eukprot:NODE_6501_length_529_cov_27.723881_g6336_i0.p1 GENE.NODE_6501_length_529_cov_27.723881_g6336_i0~~NODE_6501_length_529_cov_27.723881_g6336_i0.p1  ORF type:complete len:141 (-),score=17.06 NODE_6501_length_529_cov_27.723881_g6336_i0:48-470(-)
MPTTSMIVNRDFPLIKRSQLNSHISQTEVSSSAKAHNARSRACPQCWKVKDATSFSDSRVCIPCENRPQKSAPIMDRTIRDQLHHTRLCQECYQKRPVAQYTDDGEWVCDTCKKAAMKRSISEPKLSPISGKRAGMNLSF